MEKTELANREVISRIQKAQVYLVGVSTAEKEIPFLRGRKALLHSGPPVAWEDACSAMKNAALGAMVYEGWAKTLDEARALADGGAVAFGSANENHAVGPMAGIISPSMPVWKFENDAFGTEALVTFNEGLGKTLRFGANTPDVIDRLRWMQNKLGPITAEALKASGPLDLSRMIARGVQRGDEAHNRNKACTGIFFRAIAPYYLKTGASRDDIFDVLKFFDGNDHTFLNLSMGVCKATMDAVIGVEDSTIVSCMCTNGHEFGLRVAGTGEKWFTAPSTFARGNYFSSFTAADASPTLGDSYISEASGLGGSAMGAAPGIGRFIGITAAEAIDVSLRMYGITDAEHERFRIPALNFRGTPLGIDIRKVVETGVLPVINTGIAHREPGIGQIGAGIVYPPMECFKKAAAFMGL
jgi:hypothetical protein